MAGAPSDSFLGGLFRTSSAGNMARRVKRLRNSPAYPVKPKNKPRGTRVIDSFAEELANVGDVPTAAANLGLNRDYANSLFARIRKELGPQAC